MKKICIVEFLSNLGLKEPQPGKEPGVKNLPDWFWKHNLHKAINPKNIQRLDPSKYNNTRDPETHILNANSLVDYTREQAYLINNLLSQNKFSFVIGGDCSILPGPAIDANIKHSTKLIQENPIIKEQKAKIVSMRYDVHNGKITHL